jgi:hypothetical protein
MRATAHTPSSENKAHFIQQQLDTKYPDLTVSTTESKIYIRGSFPIVHEGNVLDRYQIEIEWSDSDTEAPVLREPGGRIPREDNRHMDGHGKACPLVPEEWLIRGRDTRTVILILTGRYRITFYGRV